MHTHTWVLMSVADYSRSAIGDKSLHDTSTLDRKIILDFFGMFANRLAENVEEEIDFYLGCLSKGIFISVSCDEGNQINDSKPCWRHSWKGRWMVDTIDTRIGWTKGSGPTTEDEIRCKKKSLQESPLCLKRHSQSGRAGKEDNE